MKTHIFDMDGLLIDSEPFWRASEIKVFQSLHIPFNEDMCRETVGMRIDEVVDYWNKKIGLSLPIKPTADAIIEELISMVKIDGNALPGVNETLELLNKKDRVCTLASSSSMRIIEAVVDVLGIREYFKDLHSAEYEMHGKPAPDVFLTSAKNVNSSPSDCIVYEDSRNGMLAGLSANMKVVIIPEFPQPHIDWHDQAHLKLCSLEEFDLEKVELL